jgi:hypothetical protein
MQARNNELLTVRSLKIILGGIAFLLVGFAIYIFFAGATVELENRAGEPIKDIRIDYEIGSFSLSNLEKDDLYKKRLGKVGEGLGINAIWETGSGLNREAKFDVYFHGLTGYDKVTIRFLPHGKSELLYNGEKQ